MKSYNGNSCSCTTVAWPSHTGYFRWGICECHPMPTGVNIFNELIPLVICPLVLVAPSAVAPSEERAKSVFRLSGVDAQKQLDHADFSGLCGRTRKRWRAPISCGETRLGDTVSVLERLSLFGDVRPGPTAQSCVGMDV